MKKQLLTAAAVLLSCYTFSQTKGTSALSLGVNSNTTEVTNQSLTDDQTTKVTNSSYSLGYGLFIKDNNKLSVELTYNKGRTSYYASPENSESKGLGLGVSYQRYFPLLKTFYAYAGGAARYMHFKGNTETQSGLRRNNDGDNYSLRASGGLAWFINKRWALEANLVSAGLDYNKGNYYESLDDQIYTTKSSSFNLSTSGSFNNLGFGVFFMF